MNLDERNTQAWEAIAAALGGIAKTLELEYQRKYPAKKAPRDADVTYLKTEEEELREEQGQTGEKTVSEWTSIGPREKAFLDREKS